MNTYTEERSCQMCGKKHTLTFCEYDALYLDGIPATPVSQALQGYALCSECGFLYPYTPNEFVDVWAVYTSDEYQGVLHDDTLDENEKKLKLYSLLHCDFPLPLYLSHYYAEIGTREKEVLALQNAANAITQGEDCGVYDTARLPFKRFHMPYKFSLSEDCRLIDIYRRMGNFNAARAEINKMHNSKHVTMSPALSLYCQEEEALIRACETQLL